MIYETIDEFFPSLPSYQPLLGLDLGEKTVGLALSDVQRSIATPLLTIKRVKFTIDAAELLSVMTKHSVCGLVLGLPRNMDGTEGVRCQKTRAFARNFSAKWEGSISFWDERLSTVAAERALLEADTSRKRRSEVIDHVAASYILQGALDRMRHL